MRELAPLLALLPVAVCSVWPNCTALQPRPNPTHVRDLRVDAFKVVMAMGDSMTGGYNSVKPDMKEYRGVSFSIGGDQGSITLPNLMKPFSGELVGASLGVVPKPVRDVCDGAIVDKNCRLNAAVDGSSVARLLHEQIPYLHKTLSTAAWAGSVDMQNDWKLLTIFSGMDDAVFDLNGTKLPTDPVALEATMDQLLNQTQALFPRTFVNILLLPEQFDTKLQSETLKCRIFKKISEISGIHWTDPSTWLNATQAYNQVYVRLAAHWNAKRLPGFAVSVQPMQQRKYLSRADFDTGDCFHPTLKTHQAMAVGLWNNMLATSLADRKTTWEYLDQPACPAEDSRLVF